MAIVARGASLAVTCPASVCSASAKPYAAVAYTEGKQHEWLKLRLRSS